MSSFFIMAFALAIGLFWRERKIFTKLFQGINRSSYIILLIIIIGFVLVCGIFGLNFISFQEASHEWEAFGFAKRIAEGDKLVFNNILHGLGYPLIIAVGFKLFGIYPVFASLINLFLAIMSIVLIFLLCKALWNKDLIGLVAAFLYATNPLVFSFTAFQMGEPTISGFYLLLIALVGLLSFREKKPGLHLLTLLLITIAAQTRLEYIILLLPYLIIFIKNKEYQRVGLNRFIIFFIIFLILSAPVFTLNSRLKESYESGWAGGTQSYYDDKEHVYSLPIANQIDYVLKPLTNKAYSINFMIYDMPGFYYFWSSKYFYLLILFIIIGIALNIKRKIKGNLYVLGLFCVLSWSYLAASVFYEARFAIPTFTLLVGYGAYAIFELRFAGSRQAPAIWRLKY
jgi:4-amino-4-deoxy-L-arabinose transferase-like glycosyltransferase